VGTALIVLVALAGLLVGAVSLVSPLHFLHIYNRKIAAAIVCGSMMVYLPASGHLSLSTAAAIPAQVADTKPASLDGCDLAGAIPDCKQEVARLAADQAAHPLPPPPVVPDAPKDRSADRLYQEFVSDIEAERNARIAAEARANLAAHDRQRRLDDADAEVARNRENLEQRIAQNSATTQRRRLDAERAQYGARVQQRIWQQKLRDRQR
jgi:hypothetical protein